MKDQVLNKSYNIKKSKELFQSATITLKKAYELKDNKLFYQSISLYEDSISLNPKNSESYIALSYIAWKMNEHEKALLLLKKAREFDSFNIKISKQTQMIKDDLISIEKSKILNKYSSKVISESEKSSNNIISSGIKSIKSIISIDSSKKEVIENNNHSSSHDILKNISNESKRLSVVKKENIIKDEKKHSDSNESIFEALNKIKNNTPNIKLKASSKFLSKIMS